MKHIQYNYQTMQYVLIIGLIASILSFYLVTLKNSGSSHVVQNIVFNTNSNIL